MRELVNYLFKKKKKLSQALKEPNSPYISGYMETKQKTTNTARHLLKVNQTRNPTNL